MQENKPTLYFCKLSKDYPEQLIENFYAGGQVGNGWYNGVEPGSLIFAINAGKVHKLWRAKEYTQIPNKINSLGVLTFETLKVYDPPVSVVSEFLFCKHFVLDLNLLNKSSKQTLKGFYPITLNNNSPLPQAIDFKNEKRRIFITKEKDEFGDIDDQDIVINLENNDKLTLLDIFYRNSDSLERYEPLYTLYKTKYDTEPCEIIKLYESAVSLNRIKRRNYLQQLIEWLQENHAFEVKNAVALYDNIISGNLKAGGKKRYWAGGILWEDEDMTDKFTLEGYWRIGYKPEDSPGAIYYDRIAQIKTGDRFVLKKWGGFPQLRIYAIGTVTGVSAADEGMIKVVWDKKPFKLYEGAAPLGEGAGNWRSTLIEVRRPDIIKLIFDEEVVQERSSFDKNVFGTILTEVPNYPVSRLRTNGTEAVLGVKDLAADLAKVIKLTTNEPGNMVGIFGRWGRGKTYFFEQLWKELEKDRDFVKAEFHAWKYQDTPASWAYLYETVAEAYFNDIKYAPVHVYHEPLEFKKFRRRFLLNIYRVNLFQLYMLLMSIVAGMFGIFYWDKIKHETITLIAALGLGGLTLLPTLLKKHKAEAKSLFKKYTDRVSYTKLLGFQAEIHKELKILLKLWFKLPQKRRLLLFVDDIDRCREDRIIEIVDSLRVMLEDDEIWSRIVVVAAIDERLLQRAVSWKYRELLTDNKNDASLYELVREYLDKLFITGVKLGELNDTEKVEVYFNISAGHIEPSKVKPEKITHEPATYFEDETDDEDFEDDELEYKLVDGDSKYELTSADSNALLESINSCIEITPRQIRVIYFRYIFARRLVLMKTSGRQLFKVFNELEPSILAELVCMASESPDPKWFKNKKKEVESNPGKTGFIILRKEIKKEANKELLLIIINCLEIVVAY